MDHQERDKKANYLKYCLEMRLNFSIMVYLVGGMAGVE